MVWPTPATLDPRVARGYFPLRVFPLRHGALSLMPPPSHYPSYPPDRADGPDGAGGAVVAGRPRASILLLAVVLAAPVATWAGDAERFAALAEAGPVSESDCRAHHGWPVVLRGERAYDVAETARRAGRVIDQGKHTIVVYSSRDEGGWSDALVPVCAFKTSAEERVPSAGD
jgi:hypothetical protein